MWIFSGSFFFSANNFSILNQNQSLSNHNPSEQALLVLQEKEKESGGEAGPFLHRLTLWQNQILSYII